jgi:hypothetical protein
MTSREFCYWLQGYFEINGNQPRPPEHSDSLNGEQVKMIQRHLAMVFKHEIDPSYGPKEHLQKLGEIHKGQGAADIFTSPPLPHTDLVLRC